jgi:hypothetical protein
MACAIRGSHCPSTLGNGANIMRKSWLVIGLVVAGGLYYWTGEEEQPETVSKPAPPEAGTTIGTYGRIPDPPRQTRDRQWGSTETRPAQDRERYNAFTPAPEYGSYLPPYQEHSFRPLNDGRKSLTRRKPMTTPAYPPPPEWQRNYQPPPDRGYQVHEAPAYQAFPERSQAVPMPGYRFRPQDSRGQPDRWIGNYPRIPSTGPTSPIRSYPPEPKANYAFSW